jgi:hypothetical protein
VKSGSQCHRVLAVLADYKPHTVPEIHRKAGTMRLNSRIAELRDRYGYDIACEHVSRRKGAAAYRYKLSPPAWGPLPPELAELRQQREQAAAFDPTAVPWDNVAPRRPEEKFRIYALRDGDQLDLIATCATPAAVGVALVTLGSEGEFKEAAVGILDSNGTDERPGKWLVSPWEARVR